jgi:hypothetical protein
MCLSMFYARYYCGFDGVVLKSHIGRECDYESVLQVRYYYALRVECTDDSLGFKGSSIVE